MNPYEFYDALAPKYKMNTRPLHFFVKKRQVNAAFVRRKNGLYMNLARALPLRFLANLHPQYLMSLLTI
jgi:hypothetical protein